MAKRKNKKISKSKVLEQQKPKRKWRVSRNLKKTFLLSLAGLAVYYAYHNRHKVDFIELSQLIQGSGEKDHEVKLSIFPEVAKDDEVTVRQLFSAIDRLSRSELKSRLQQAQELLAAKAISMIQIRPHHFALFIEFHTPKFAIDLGKARFVNNQGEVFGFFKEGQHSWLPILRGLKLTQKPEFFPNQTMKLDLETKTVVDEALFLLDLSLSYNITYRELHFDPYRGFRGQLSNHRISVELGREPFDTRLSRLRKILDDLTQKGVSSAHIELDYQGKAFVQELGS